jgi:hypothetical protein
MAKLKESARTISAETMKSVMEFVPMDGFRLSDDLLNKEYTVIDVNETEFGDRKSFTVTLEDKDGKVVNLSAGILKRARVLSKSEAKGGDSFKDTDNVFTRSEAEELWNGSVYFHTVGDGMKKDEDFVIPETIKLRYAIIAEDSETGEPAYSPFLYKGYRKVVAEYQKRDEFPTFDDFKEELAKTKEEGRIAGLPANLTKPELQNWVKADDVSNYRSTLIVADFENE